MRLPPICPAVSLETVNKFTQASFQAQGALIHSWIPNTHAKKELAVYISRVKARPLQPPSTGHDDKERNTLAFLEFLQNLCNMWSKHDWLRRSKGLLFPSRCWRKIECHEWSQMKRHHLRNCLTAMVASTTPHRSFRVTMKNKTDLKKKTKNKLNSVTPVVFVISIVPGLKIFCQHTLGGLNRESAVQRAYLEKHTVHCNLWLRLQCFHAGWGTRPSASFGLSDSGCKLIKH